MAFPKIPPKKPSKIDPEGKPQKNLQKSVLITFTRYIFSIFWRFWKFQKYHQKFVSRFQYFYIKYLFKIYEKFIKLVFFCTALQNKVSEESDLQYLLLTESSKFWEKHFWRTFKNLCLTIKVPFVVSFFFLILKAKLRDIHISVLCKISRMRSKKKPWSNARQMFCFKNSSEQ